MAELKETGDIYNLFANRIKYQQFKAMNELFLE